MKCEGFFTSIDALELSLKYVILLKVKQRHEHYKNPDLQATSRIYRLVYGVSFVADRG